MSDLEDTNECDYCGPVDGKVYEFEPDNCYYCVGCLTGFTELQVEALEQEIVMIQDNAKKARAEQ